MKDYRLTVRQIRDFVGSRSFELGEEHFESGDIFDARCEEGKLSAGCYGSYQDAYRVRATLNENGVKSASCTCPVGSGSCKHVAALLLTWAKSPELVVRVEETERLLESRSKEELVALVKQMLRRRPELEALVAAMPAPGKPAEPGVYHKQADALFASASGAWDEAAELAEELQLIIEEADDLVVAKRWRDGAAVYQGILESLLNNLCDYDDDAGALTDVLLMCVAGLGRCLPGLEDAELRLGALWTLMNVVSLDNEMGGYGFSDEAEELIEKHASVEQRRQMVERLRREGADESWLRSYEETLLSDDEFAAVCRATGRLDALIQRLLGRKRVEEAASVALHADEAMLPHLADMFVMHGQAQAAEEWMRQRAHRSTRPEVLHWLRERCSARGDHQAALEYARREYQARPTLQGYEQVRRLAKRLKQWDAIRSDALRLLASRAEQKATAVKALVTEGMVEEAVSVLRTERLDHLSTWLAQSVEKSRPDVSIELYATEADRLIALRSRPNYREACRLLSRARKLCSGGEEQEVWKTRIAAVQKRCSGLPALLAEMRSAKLI